MGKDKKPIYTGKIEQDADGNYFCDIYLLDYRKVASGFSLGEEIHINSVEENQSDKSNTQYPFKSKNFVSASKSKFIK
jgi:hypothetical protein